MIRRWLATVRALLGDVRARAHGHDLMLIAAGLTLYAGIAVVPLLLVGLYGTGVVIGAERAADIVEHLARYTPPTMGVQAIVRRLGEVGPQLGIPALIAAILTASTYGEGLLRAVATLEGQPAGNRTLAGRIRALPYLGVFPLVTMAGLLTVAGLSGLLGGGTLGRVLGVYFTFVIGWLSAAALLAVLYRLFAGRVLRWAAIVWGSLSAGSFLAGMSLGWLLLLRFGVTVGRAFGGVEELGRVVLFAVYLLLVQVVVLLGYLLVLAVDRLLTGPTDAGDSVDATPRETNATTSVR